MGSVNYTFDGPRLKLATIAKARAGLLEVTLQAEEMIRRLCPVRTGFLRDSIDISAGTAGGAHERDLTFFIQVSAPYATYVEYGTARQEPQPFVRPVIEWVRENMASIIQAYAFSSGDPMEIPGSYQDAM